MTEYPRDLVGYAGDPPDARWPDGARIALQIVVNYEEGGESSVLHGDPASESFLTDIAGARPYPGARHMSVESIYEYGGRAGFWRLHRLFTERGLPVTVFGVTTALERNPAAIEAMRNADWEIACHGLKWIPYQDVPEEVERDHMRRAIELHTRVCGKRPLGWYTGRDSPNTRRLVAECGGFLYHADSYADDLPYWCTEFDPPLLAVPYTLDANDMRFATPQGFRTGRQFCDYLTDTFDYLYEEGAVRPRLMSVGLHCRLAGRPGRTDGLRRFLDHVARFDNVWICRRVDVARHWHETHPPR